SPEFFLHGEIHFRILDGGRDLKAVPHNSAIAQQPLNVALAVPGDFLRAKPIERVPIVFPLFQNGGPAQPGLRTFKNKELEEQSIIMHRDAPFLIVISNVWFSCSPGTTRHRIMDLWLFCYSILSQNPRRFGIFGKTSFPS